VRYEIYIYIIRRLKVKVMTLKKKAVSPIQLKSNLLCFELPHDFLQRTVEKK